MHDMSAPPNMTGEKTHGNPNNNMQHSVSTPGPHGHQQPRGGSGGVGGKPDGDQLFAQLRGSLEGNNPNAPQQQLQPDNSAAMRNLSVNLVGNAGGNSNSNTLQHQETPIVDTKPRIRRHELGPEREFRVLVDDKLYEPVTIKVLGVESSDPRSYGRGNDKWAVDDPSRTAELFGREMVIDQEYPIFPGSRNGFFSWKGCTLQITGGTVQEFVEMNPQMRDYANAAAIVERRRAKASESMQGPGQQWTAPRILITGEPGSGKSVVSEIFYNYALKTERTPIYVDCDPRYTASVSDGLRGLPACMHAVIPDLLESDVTKRLTFFFGDLDWKANQKLYEQICIRLATVVKAKLSGTLQSPEDEAKDLGGGIGGIVGGADRRGLNEARRIVQSGMIMNGPENATSEILTFLVKEFQIDVVFVLCDKQGTVGRHLVQELKQNLVSESVDVVPLEKTTGAYLENADTLRMQRHQRMRDYFQGVSPLSNGFPTPPSPRSDPMQLNSGNVATKNAYNNPLFSFLPLNVHYGSFPLSHMNLLEYTTIRVQQPNGDVGYQLATQVFDRSKYQQLIHTALGVIRAQSEDDLLYAQLAGYILVTGLETEKNVLHVAMPDVPPLPSNYFLVPSDIPNMTFIDALTPPG